MKKPTRRPFVEPDGFQHLPGYFDAKGQQALLDDIRTVVAAAPLFAPTMPRTGRPLSVRMSNCGPLGWVADKIGGYRYQATHPDTGMPWPPMPARLLALWEDVTGGAPSAEACLINWYAPDAKMGLHVDRDEEDTTQPVVSVSLGDDAWFRLGGPERGAPTARYRLMSGDIVVLGGAARLAHHGVDRILPRTSTLLAQPGRINLTLRRVTSCASNNS